MIKSKILVALLLSGIQTSLEAGEVDIPNTFSAGTPAVAADVNSNFTAVEVAVDGNAVDIGAILATVTSLQASVASLEADVANLESENTVLIADVAGLESSVTSLETDNASLQNFITSVIPYLQGGEDEQGQASVFFSGVNVHINNGSGNTDSVNAIGNLVIGYDEGLTASVDFCTADDNIRSAYLNQIDCEANSGIWGAAPQKIGSHNLIIGTGHNYTQSAGLIAGFQNTVTAANSVISGGASNFAQGHASSVSGGIENTASGETSSVSGGSRREAISIDDWAAGSLSEDN
ncbi:MAG: hypothetical protein KUG78_21315 [Kangiellaceae bacterium]|nr:hypothetical protein [Kangiellaceae bacterium]